MILGVGSIAVIRSPGSFGLGARISPQIEYFLSWQLAGVGLVLVNTLPITKKNKHTVVTEAPKKVYVLLSR